MAMNTRAVIVLCTSHRDGLVHAVREQLPSLKVPISYVCDPQQLRGREIGQDIVIQRTAAYLCSAVHDEVEAMLESRLARNPMPSARFIAVDGVLHAITKCSFMQETDEAGAYAPVLYIRTEAGAHIQASVDSYYIRTGRSTVHVNGLKVEGMISDE